MKLTDLKILFKKVSNSIGTRHSAYDATSTKSNGVKIDGFYVDSKKVSEKFLLRHYPVLKNHPLPVAVEELFTYFFGIYIRFGYKNPSILTPLDSVDIAS